MSHTVVLKFGSSVLRSSADLPVAVDEIYRHVREGRRVIAVVSAFAGVTDSLIERAHGVGGHADPYAYAALVGSGEIESAAMLALSLAQHGVPARLLPPEQFTLRAHGDPLDAEPHDFDRALLRATLEDVPVVVVPGFVAHDEQSRTMLLGRGGSDFTALFLAGRLGADCILIKDVDGLYERDPAGPGPAPRRFTQVTWDDALRVAGRLVQPKTIRFAHLHRQSFSVTCAGAAHATVVGPGPSRLDAAVRAAPLRVVLLGLGTVGRGVYERLSAQPDRFEVVRAVVRDPAGHIAAGVPAPLLSTNPWDAINEEADVIVEALGGEFPATEVILASLLAGRSVVTANKAAVAAHWDSFAPFAAGPAPRLRLSAAAGGAVPAARSRRTRVGLAPHRCPARRPQRHLQLRPGSHRGGGHVRRGARGGTVARLRRGRSRGRRLRARRGTQAAAVRARRRRRDAGPRRLLRDRRVVHRDRNRRRSDGAPGGRARPA